MEQAPAHAQPSFPDTTTGIHNNKVGVWLFIASEVMFFSSLIVAMMLIRASAGKPSELFVSSLVLVSVNTFILVTSSLFMALSLAFVRRGRRRAYLPTLLITALLGTIFVGIQFLVEYPRLMGEGLTFDGVPYIFGSIFYLLTGFHGLHVLVGVLWIGVMLIRGLLGHLGPGNSIGVESAGLYWHFVDAVWIVLFTIIYLIP